ncbi:MAG: competence/damage-inducible protein A [Flavobacteriaceae bacterium]
MLAEIITIGDEILIGQIVDTNSAHIASELNKIGISVFQITTVQDDREHILKAFEEAEERAEVIILTGGLGPTKDDITKKTLCEYLNDTLVSDPEVLAHVEELFDKYINTPISEINRRQALVPSRARVLHNKYGTAPGMWIQGNKAIFVSLPGVPFEMKQLMHREVIPKLADSFDRPFICHKTLVTYGLGESAIAERISAIEQNLPDSVKLAYLPNLGKVRLRITAKGSNNKQITEDVDQVARQLYETIGDLIYGEEEQGAIEVTLGKLFTEKKKSLATAESFTGGKIAEQLTSVPGASAYFKGSVVSYATSVKIDVLKVPAEMVKEHSVVSAEVAKAMAKNVKKLTGSDFAVATTGNAGPSKGDSDADIGNVFIAIATPNNVYAERYSMGNHRTRIVQKSVHMAMQMLQKEILKF